MGRRREETTRGINIGGNHDDTYNGSDDASIKTEMTKTIISYLLCSFDNNDDNDKVTVMKDYQN